MNAIAACFKRIRWLLSPNQPTPMTIVLSGALDANKQPQALRAQLFLLRAMRFRGRISADTLCVRIAWPHGLTQESLQALQGLPHWPCCLDICSVSWSAEADLHVALAQHVPVSYTQWLIGVSTPHIAEHMQAEYESLVASVCAALNARRGALGLPGPTASLIPWPGGQGGYFNVTRINLAW